MQSKILNARLIEKRHIRFLLWTRTSLLQFGQITLITLQLPEKTQGFLTHWYFNAFTSILENDESDSEVKYHITRVL